MLWEDPSDSVSQAEWDEIARTQGTTASRRVGVHPGCPLDRLLHDPSWDDAKTSGVTQIGAGTDRPKKGICPCPAW